MSAGRAAPGSPRRRVLVIANLTEAASTGMLFQRLSERLASRAETRFACLGLPRGVGRKVLWMLRPWGGVWRPFWRSDVLVVHTPVAFTAAYVLLARLLGKRVVAFLWDVYPESIIDTGLLRRSLAVRLMGWLERRVLDLAHAVLVPSGDFMAAPQVRRLERARVFPTWAISDRSEMPVPASAEALRIGFAGLIDPIRDLEGATHALAAATSSPVQLHVWSRDPFAPSGLPERVEVVHHGFVPQDELMQDLAGMDAGLVCLAPGFGWPAFPAKLLSYVSAGLPVLFRGPPAPALRRILAETGAGLTLDDGGGDIAGPLREMRADFAARQDAFLAQSELTDERLAEVLGRHA